MAGLVATREQEAESRRLEDILARYGRVPFVRSIMSPNEKNPLLSSAEDGGRFYVFPQTQGGDPLMDAIRAKNYIPFNTQEKADTFLSILKALS